MDLPEAGPVHVVPVPALAHQFVDVLGAVFRQGKNDLKEEKCIRMNDKKKKKRKGYTSKLRFDYKNVIVHSLKIFRCIVRTIRINRNKLKGLVKISSAFLKKKIYIYGINTYLFRMFFVYEFLNLW